MKYSAHLIVIDFDGVLFNDTHFKNDYELLFYRAGISRDAYAKTYEKTKKQGHYDPRIHIHLALADARGGSVVEKNLFSQIKKFLDQSSRYVYGDVKEFLTFLKKGEINMVLLSTGDTVFQKQKIAKSGLSDFFDDIVIIPHASKGEALDLIMRKKRPESIMFIDDKKEVVEDIKYSLPSVYVVQMQRSTVVPMAQHIDCSVATFTDLKEFVNKWKSI